ncbi:MAG: helix-turn-helix domain-containing protein, partial [Kiritimatiellae bacterium]|nr:helix-turn-helix domain-containing protein [Kiritimatiellia bacterium]
MNGIGAKLRRAREARGYSQSQIADMTRILVQIVQGLEEEDFSRIVAPIYGRGFVKLYAQAVGLDPAECVREFMEAYSGIPAVEKAPERTEPPPAEAATPVEEPPPPPAEEEEEDEESAPDEEQQPLPTRRVSRYAPPMPE